MSDRDHAFALLDAAELDLKALQGMQHPSLPGMDFFSITVFGFHAQQAAEKSLKAWLAFKEVLYPHTHNLPALLRLLEDTGEDMNEWLHLVELTPFAVQLRYGSVSIDEEALDRAETLARVERICLHVRQLLEI